jgi:DNA-binding MarR family transcriptional regulator
VLKLLALKPRMEQKEIADLMGVRLRALDELLGEMESQHLVTREQPDEPDMRIVVVELTDEGREAGSTDDTVTEPQLVPELDEDDRSKLVDLLKVLNAQFEAMGLRDEDRGGRGGFRGGTRGGRTERRGTFRGDDRGSRDDRRDGGRGGFRGSRDERGVFMPIVGSGALGTIAVAIEVMNVVVLETTRKGWRGERVTRSARYRHNERTATGHRGHTGGFGARSGRGFGSSN